jgi:putative transposase
VEKRKIFTDKNDYRRFLILLYLCNNTEPVNLRDIFDKGLTFEELFNLERKETLVGIGAYCLMPNHIHLLITPTKENSISLLMQKIFTGYTMYFNKKSERSGRLFESTFKANLIDNDEYLKYLFAYIHLNPVKLIEPLWRDRGIKNSEKAKEFLNNYRWSSYSSYADEGENNPLLNKKSFPEYFCRIKEFRNFIEEWLKYKDSNFP